MAPASVDAPARRGPDRSEPPAAIDPLPIVRSAVRDVLLAAPAYRDLPPERRKELARAMVAVSRTAANLLLEELRNEPAASVTAREPGPTESRPAGGAIASSQSAGSEFSGVAADRIAATTRRVLNAVSFSRFVTELITGVFKAMLDSNAQQLASYIDLLNNVATSAEGFAGANMSADGARQWIVERYPGSFEFESGGDEDDFGGVAPGQAERERRIRLREGAAPPSDAALRTELGLSEGETVPAGDPERALVPLVRGRLAKSRQEMLATMLLLGMQRIVVDGGRVSAAMRFHIDTRSAARADAGTTADARLQLAGSANLLIPKIPLGVSGGFSSSVGFVSTQSAQSSEEMNTDLDLNSSVEIQFRTDQVPLDRLASPGQSAQIRAQSRNPEAEENTAAREREARRAGAERVDLEQRRGLEKRLAPREAPPLAGGPSDAPPAPAAGPSGDAPAKAVPAARGGVGAESSPETPAPVARGE